MTRCIHSPNFTLDLRIRFFEADINYPCNAILSVFVNSDGFCAAADMDIDIKQFADFADDLAALSSALSGTATIREPYGEQQFIRFSAEPTGHIRVSGRLCSGCRDGLTQELAFENRIDQTQLPDLIREVNTLHAV